MSILWQRVALSLLGLGCFAVAAYVQPLAIPAAGLGGTFLGWANGSKPGEGPKAKDE